MLKIHSESSPHAALPIDCGRWIDLSGAGESVTVAAQQTVRARLDAVRLYLPLAALRADETLEHVHRLRVSTRRVLAALQLYRGLLPRRRARWMRNQMKEIRRVAGAARDLDVLIQRYESSGSKKQRRLLKQLRKSRKRRQHAIVALYRSLIETGKLERKIKRLIANVKHPIDVSLDEFARMQLKLQTKRFFKVARGDLASIRQLHQFRIKAKGFRYAIELLRDVLPAAVASEIYPVICKTQDMLGELNDHSIAHQRLKRLARSEKRKATARRLEKLCRFEKRQVKRARKDFHAWWTTEFMHEFESELRSLLK